MVARSPIPPSLVELLGEPYAATCATRDAALVPEPATVWGVIADVPARRLRFFVPRFHIGKTPENLSNNRQIAITIARLGDYRTFQLKGRALAWAPALPDEQAFIEGYARSFAAAADFEGIGDSIRRVAPWPCLAIDMEVDEIFAQTPGPGTGKRIDA